MLYVAVGAGDTVGVGTADPQRQAWPRVFLHTALPAETYESQLRMAVRRLRRGGRTTVLVANTPAVEQLPVVASYGIPTDLVRHAVEAYNAAIERVVQVEGAHLVDLHTRPIEAELVATDGFHPSPAGHAAVAAAFASVYREPPKRDAMNASEAS